MYNHLERNSTMSLYLQASIPASCFEGSPKMVLPSSDQQRSGRRGGWVDAPQVLAHKCSYDKVIYADGESWKPEDSSLACVTCSCKVNLNCYNVVLKCSLKPNIYLTI